MKTTKFLLLGLLGLLTVFAFVGCSSSDLTLLALERTATTIEQTSVDYTKNTLTDKDNTSIELSFSFDEPVAMNLAEVENPLMTFNTLRLEIIQLHEQLISERESIRAYAESIRASVSTLREQNYVLLEDDRAQIRSDIDQLKALRQTVMDTAGQAYQRIYDLRGSYTRENLPEINQVFTEVIDVLNIRLQAFQSANLLLANIDQILMDYLEN